MNVEIIGCSDRGKYSATLSPAVINALNKWNEQNGTTGESGSNDSNDNSPSTDTNKNCGCTNQEKPPYFHPPYVV